MYYIDPVCHKKLRKKEEYSIIKYHGFAYHVCCEACKQVFESNPSLYAVIKPVLGDSE